MTQGSFDDRDNARRHVKLWMQDNHPGEYTVGNLMGLARKMVEDDLEPVDDIRVQWAETSYGLLRGIAEFAADQLNAERVDASHGADGRLPRAASAAHAAAAALPYRTGQARRHLTEALELIGAQHPGDTHASTNLQRARNAISLALIMLGTPPGRSVAA